MMRDLITKQKRFYDRFMRVILAQFRPKVIREAVKNIELLKEKKGRPESLPNCSTGE